MNKLFYKTIKDHYEFEIPKIKWSRFIGNVFHVESKEEAEKHLKEMQKRYGDASHNCYAYVCWAKVNYDLFGKLEITPEHMKVSDEGEPANTAGKPIRAQIHGHELQNVLVVVTRYFWWTLLGVGWLIQAYGDCAKQAIEQSKIVETEILKNITFSYHFDLVPIVRNVVNKFNAKIVDEKYDKEVECEIRINSGYFESFRKELSESSKGQIKI